MILSAIYSLFAATAAFIVAFMHTPMTEEVFVEPPEEANLLKDKVWRLRRALNGLRCAAAAFQAYLESLLEDAGFRRAWRLRPSTTGGRQCEDVSTRR